MAGLQSDGGFQFHFQLYWSFHIFSFVSYLLKCRLLTQAKGIVSCLQRRYDFHVHRRLSEIVANNFTPKVFKEKISVYSLIGATGFWSSLCIEYLGAILNAMLFIGILYYLELRKRSAELGVGGNQKAEQTQDIINNIRNGPQSDSNALQLVNLTKKFTSERGEAVLANENVSFSVRRGEIFCIIFRCFFLLDKLLSKEKNMKNLSNNKKRYIRS